MRTVGLGDEALLLSGDPEDFGRFYDRYVDAMLAYFQRRTRDPEVAADLTAETFAAALVARRRYRRSGATPAGWLYGIAQHKLADYWRHGHAEDRMRRRLDMEAIPFTAEDAELVRWLGEDAAEALVTALPADQAAAVRAHVLEDRDYAEVARDVHASEAVVRQRVSRGLRALRDRVGGGAR
jgi:RNA polymerase sigma-70 factor (ECF subfamily)